IRTFVEVSRPEDDEADVPTLPPWLCTSPGVSCGPGLTFVSGRIASPWIYFTARHLCERKSHCLFTAVMTDEAQEQWVETLRTTLGPSYAVRLGALGLTSVTRLCQDQKAEDLRREVEATVS